MSSLFRMLLIAILAEKKTQEEEKDRRDKVKTALARELLMELERSCITGVTLLKWSRKPEHMRRR